MQSQTLNLWRNNKNINNKIEEILKLIQEYTQINRNLYFQNILLKNLILSKRFLKEGDKKKKIYFNKRLIVRRSLFQIKF
jgi:hypothetical protein